MTILVELAMPAMITKLKVGYYHVDRDT